MAETWWATVSCSSRAMRLRSDIFTSRIPAARRSLIERIANPVRTTTINTTGTPIAPSCRRRSPVLPATAVPTMATPMPMIASRPEAHRANAYTLSAITPKLTTVLVTPATSIAACRTA